MTPARLVAVLAATACAGERTPPVPGWLQPVFKDLDTLLTHSQRDSLRTIDIDSAFVFRNHELARALEGMGPMWQRTPAGDTLIARGEELRGVQVNLSQTWAEHDMMNRFRFDHLSCSHYAR